MVQMDWSILSEPVPQLILATAGLLILAVVGIYILQKLRTESREPPPQPTDWLSEFRDLRDRGLITPQEYEAIRANLRQHVRRKDQPGPGDQLDVRGE
jgi:hypothetical protein